MLYFDESVYYEWSPGFCLGCGGFGGEWHRFNLLGQFLSANQTMHFFEIAKYEIAKAVGDCVCRYGIRMKRKFSDRFH
jgi:hypothetical protein